MYSLDMPTSTTAAVTFALHTDALVDLCGHMGLHETIDAAAMARVIDIFGASDAVTAAVAALSPAEALELGALVDAELRRRYPDPALTAAY